MKYKCSICGADTDNDQSFDVCGRRYEVHRCNICDDRFHRELDWENDNAHEYESNIVCPYCDYEYSDYDSYEYINEGDCDVECECCGNIFSLKIHRKVEFSTNKRSEDMPDDYLTAPEVMPPGE